MKITIIPKNYEEIIKNGYSLDHIFILKMIDAGEDISFVNESEKLSAIKQSLIRKALIFENEEKLTILGKELIVFAETKQKGVIKKKIVKDTEFERWWKEYPGTDIFEWRGKKFDGDRTLRKDRDNCMIKFNKILIEGKYTAEQLISALILYVNKKKEMSYRTGNNQLHYMENSLTYLNAKVYESFIDLSKTETLEEQTETFNGVDI